jgi:transcriptional regulator with AAA-type ATPase domain
MRHARNLVARSKSTVLITGETGTGDPHQHPHQHLFRLAE